MTTVAAAIPLPPGVSVSDLDALFARTSRQGGRKTPDGMLLLAGTASITLHKSPASGPYRSTYTRTYGIGLGSTNYSVTTVPGPANTLSFSVSPGWITFGIVAMVLALGLVVFALGAYVCAIGGTSAAPIGGFLMAAAAFSLLTLRSLRIKDVERDRVIEDVSTNVFARARQGSASRP